MLRSLFLKIGTCFIAILFCCALTCSAHAAGHVAGRSIRESIAKDIDFILNEFQAKDITGIAIKSLSTGEMLYEHHADQRFVPASALKLFTAIAALDYLGPEFKFTTQILTDATSPVSNETLYGNLYIQFIGDPSLTLSDLKSMIRVLSMQGIRKIKGHIVIDDTAMDRDTWPAGRIYKDKILCYAAPVTATIINHNCFNLSVGRRHHSRASVKISVDKNFDQILIENRVTNRTSRRQRCPLTIKAVDDMGKNHYVLSGCLPSRRPSLSFDVALQEPNQVTSVITRDLLRDRGITYSGIQYGKTPHHAYVLVQNTSSNLAVLLKTMLKKSDNIIADSLLKKLGEKYFSSQGSWRSGVQAIQTILKSKTGINFEHLMIADGSGLSRDNAVTPNDFIRLLTFAYHAWPEGALLYEALPRSGLDGTLKHRLGGAMLGKVHAKTGTMQGTSSLAGYIKTLNNHILVFAILVNDPDHDRQAKYHLLQDRICRFLAMKTI